MNPFQFVNNIGVHIGHPRARVVWCSEHFVEECPSSGHIASFREKEVNVYHFGQISGASEYRRYHVVGKVPPSKQRWPIFDHGLLRYQKHSVSLQQSPHSSWPTTAMLSPKLAPRSFDPSSLGLGGIATYQIYWPDTRLQFLNRSR